MQVFCQRKVKLGPVQFGDAGDDCQAQTAARLCALIEAMEAAGLVGPLQSNGSREVIAPPPPETD